MRNYDKICSRVDPRRHGVRLRNQPVPFSPGAAVKFFKLFQLDHFRHRVPADVVDRAHETHFTFRQYCSPFSGGAFKAIQRKKIILGHVWQLCTTALFHSRGSCGKLSCNTRGRCQMKSFYKDTFLISHGSFWHIVGYETSVNRKRWKSLRASQVHVTTWLIDSFKNIHNSLQSQRWIMSRVLLPGHVMMEKLRRGGLGMPTNRFAKMYIKSLCGAHTHTQCLASVSGSLWTFDDRILLWSRRVKCRKSITEILNLNVCNMQHKLPQSQLFGIQKRILEKTWNFQDNRKLVLVLNGAIAPLSIWKQNERCPWIFSRISTFGGTFN